MRKCDKQDSDEVSHNGKKEKDSGIPYYKNNSRPSKSTEKGL